MDQDVARAAEALQNVSMLADVSEELLAELVRSLDHTELDAGEWLFRDGDDSDALYVVASGRLAVMDDSGQLVRELGIGSPIGELGLLGGQARSAGVVALRDSGLWRMRADTFWELLDGEPRFQRALLGTLASMLRESQAIERDQTSRVIAVIPSSPRAPIHEAVDALEATLRSFGTVAALRLDAEADTASTTRRELAERHGPELDRAEQVNDWVILVGGHGVVWRDFATSNADRIAIVAVDRAPPDWLSTPLDRPTDLVVCTDEADLVAWWDAIAPISQVLAGATPTPQGLAPLARRLGGRAIGLVLAGGGARGLSHLGVYAELVDAGVHLDRFGGTSAGALAASFFAQDIAPAEAIELARRYLVEPKSLSDYTVPLVSLIRAGRMERLGRELYGDLLLEDLPKSFFAVSTDIVTGEMVVHRRGKMWTAVRASMSIPGLMPPVSDGDRLLVDGGLLNNLPADIMLDSPDGPVVCVDLRCRYESGAGFKVFGLQPPELMRRLVWGTTDKLPSLQETLMRTVGLAARVGDYEELPGVAAVIEPDVSHIGLLNLGQIDSAVEAGRVATRAALEAHPELVG